MTRRSPRETMSSSDQTEITGLYSPIPIPKLPNFKALIEKKFKDLANGTDEDSYLAFSGVTTTRFQYIESHRRSLRAQHVRFTYLPDAETLILKVPCEPHEKAHAAMGYMIRDQLRINMGVAFDEVIPIQSTTYHGKGNTSKEADSSYKNLQLRSQVGDWPNWVIEGGMAESIQRLRGDASWWINHSRGEVQLVILVWIRPSRRTIKIETWVPAQPLLSPGPHTRARAASPRLLGRPPVPPGEQDVVLTQQDLLDLARAIWTGIA
ncbi:hypothetical protein BO78DRAFT_409776 [Aspergillus sclerotiicarbonarius CBS 121057]|uniref:Uncharacterized protein n=1 Tax=Aspergillus sclerotiicarbonarius (strain CBS 121057 / IBT 28362) TaxID=1448318 RepID=A0A319E0K3_ASPSB|nr:hypothetical protein BO78DRAFT_409776 [Aspergillus sclerotiicarbonarius CBS 121057]